MKRHEGEMPGIRMFASGKMVLPILACAVVLLAAGPAWTEEDSRAVAVSLGEVLGSEGFCGLTYDQGAVKSFMDKNAGEDGAEFAEKLRMVTGWTRYRDKTMSAADKADECTEIERMARSYGFIH